MGNTETIPFPKNTWYHYKQINRKKIFHNSKGLYAQRFQLIQDKRLPPKEELIIYKQRCQTNLPIVKVYHAQLQEEQKNICSITQKIVVFTEYIPNRINRIKSFSLNQSECLYVLDKAIQAFNELFNKFGYFQLNPEMIGFNIQGEVRCWVNEHFESNRIQKANQNILGAADGVSKQNIEKIDYKLKESIQQKIVSQIWQIIKKKSNITNRDLYQKLSYLQTFNFQKANKLVKFLISKSTKKIPDCLFFQNCLQNKKYRQYSYINELDEQDLKIKPIQIIQTQIFYQGNFISKDLQTEPIFKDFDLYREYIDNLDKNNKANIMFNNDETLIKSKSERKFQNPEELGKKKMLNQAKNTQNFFDISLSTIPVNPSKKLVPTDEETTSIPSKKKLQSDFQQPPLPLESKRASTILIPNTISQRILINNVPVLNNNGFNRMYYNSPPPTTILPRQMSPKYPSKKSTPDFTPNLSRNVSSHCSPQKDMQRLYYPRQQSIKIYPSLPNLEQNLSSRYYLQSSPPPPQPQPQIATIQKSNTFRRPFDLAVTPSFQRKKSDDKGNYI